PGPDDDDVADGARLASGVGSGTLPIIRHGRAHRTASGGHGTRDPGPGTRDDTDRKSTRLNSSHVKISYAVFCLKKKNHGSAVITPHRSIQPVGALRLAHKGHQHIQREPMRRAYQVLSDDDHE